MGYEVSVKLAYGCQIFFEWNEDDQVDHDTLDPGIRTRRGGNAMAGPLRQMLVITESEKRFGRNYNPELIRITSTRQTEEWSNRLTQVIVQEKLKCGPIGWHVWMDMF